MKLYRWNFYSKRLDKLDVKQVKACNGEIENLYEAVNEFSDRFIFNGFKKIKQADLEMIQVLENRIKEDSKLLNKLINKQLKG